MLPVGIIAAVRNRQRPRTWTRMCDGHLQYGTVCWSGGRLPLGMTMLVGGYTTHWKTASDDVSVHNSQPYTASVPTPPAFANQTRARSSYAAAEERGDGHE